MEDRCVVCDNIIPEGRMVCPQCESSFVKAGMFLQSNKSTKEEIEQAYRFMERKKK